MRYILQARSSLTPADKTTGHEFLPSGVHRAMLVENQQALEPPLQGRVGDGRHLAGQREFQAPAAFGSPDYSVGYEHTRADGPS